MSHLQAEWLFKEVICYLSVAVDQLPSTPRRRWFPTCPHASPMLLETAKHPWNVLFLTVPEWKDRQNPLPYTPFEETDPCHID